MKGKIGVYVCSCGTNISDTVDVEELIKDSKKSEDVQYAKIHKLLCSEEGKKYLTEDLLKEKPERIVIAACSPKEHELTFRKICRKSGLNPYLFQMVNIREQVAWVTDDKQKATAKAGAYINGAQKRVLLHESIEKKEIDCNPDALVIGAGPAGMEAALLLAEANRKVYLVEKSPCIGGKVTRYEEVFPKMECASCMLEPKMDEVLHNENIELYTYSEVENVIGFLGNFIVRIRKKAKFVDKEKCFGCAACYEPCPVRVKNEFDYNLSSRKAIYTPYAGALPNAPVIDRENCLRKSGNDCLLCREACAFGAINYDEKDEIIEKNVGSIVVATGFDLFDVKEISDLGYGKIPEVYTGLEFERILSQTGPTGGRLLMKNQKVPASVAIIHCVGSRTKKYKEYCSGVCCLYALKFARLIRKNLPKTEVTHIFTDLCLPGKDHQAFFESLKNEIKLIRTALPLDVKLKQNNGGVALFCKDITGKKNEIQADMVVLCPAMIASSETEKISQMLGISRGKDGFFIEAHTKLAPVSTAISGILIAGCSQGPKDIQSSIAQGDAVSGRILSTLVPGRKLEIEAVVSEINDKLCSGCKLCINLCPYKAITYKEEEKVSAVNEILCKGCGVCAASCPSGAAKGKHFTTQQIFAEIEGVLK